jgi:hypothetical protein
MELLYFLLMVVQDLMDHLAQYAELLRQSVVVGVAQYVLHLEVIAWDFQVEVVVEVLHRPEPLVEIM